MGSAGSSSAQIISPPKGGGAQQGLGEKFAPDLHTGTGNFSVPLILAAGRSGFQPQLTLQYSTGNGNGPFGLGWAISIPGISRQTARGLPRYRDDLDTFVLTGAEDLVPVEQRTPDIVRYRPRTEGLFATVEHHRTATTDHWEVTTKDGLQSVYGTIDQRGADSAARSPRATWPEAPSGR